MYVKNVVQKIFNIISLTLLIVIVFIVGILSLVVRIYRSNYAM